MNLLYLFLGVWRDTRNTSCSIVARVVVEESIFVRDYKRGISDKRDKVEKGCKSCRSSELLVR